MNTTRNVRHEKLIYDNIRLQMRVNAEGKCKHVNHDVSASLQRMVHHNLCLTKSQKPAA